MRVGVQRHTRQLTTALPFLPRRLFPPAWGLFCGLRAGTPLRCWESRTLPSAPWRGRVLGLSWESSGARTSRARTSLLPLSYRGSLDPAQGGRPPCTPAHTRGPAHLTWASAGPVVPSLHLAPRAETRAQSGSDPGVLRVSLANPSSPPASGSSLRKGLCDPREAAVPSRKDAGVTTGSDSGLQPCSPSHHRRTRPESGGPQSPSGSPSREPQANGDPTSKPRAGFLIGRNPRDRIDRLNVSEAQLSGTECT